MFIISITGALMRTLKWPTERFDLSDIEEVEYEDLSDTTDYEPYYN